VTLHTVETGISLTPNGQNLHVIQFTNISNANFEFVEIQKHWGGVWTASLTISEQPFAREMDWQIGRRGPTV
jgi:hypothetical protein